MGPRRAYALLLLVVAVVFAASFAIARAVRDEPEPSAPPPAVVAPAVPLVQAGAPARIPALRPQPRPPTTTVEE
jgi:hypothetical protein